MSEQELLDECMALIGSRFLGASKVNEYRYATNLIVGDTGECWQFKGGSSPSFGKLCSETNKVTGIHNDRTFTSEALKPICEVELNADTLLKIVKEGCNPQRLYGQGLLLVRGDSRAALPLISLWGL